MPLLLHFLLATPPTPAVGLDAAGWWAHHQAVAVDFKRPIDRAIVGGFSADRLGYAFLSGYGEAISQLGTTGQPATATAPAALCATEEAGAHPRAIKTTLLPRSGEGGGLELVGRKGFVTFGTLVRTLLIVATEGTDEHGRQRLAMVRIPADRPGVTIRTQAELPFVPEIPHATIELDHVAVSPDERLPGDGYERYLKPFRTIEDLHVMGALLGWLVQLGRRSGWPQPVVQELLMLVTAGAWLAAAPPLDAAVHVALGGWLDRLERLLADLESSGCFAQVDPETRRLWERDRPLLRVAGKVRAQRLATAWDRLGQRRPSSC